MKSGKAAAALAAFLVVGCRGVRDGRTAADDPCLHMKAEARTADRLKNEIRRLADRIEADADRADRARGDTAAKVEAESLLAFKEEILAQTITSMSASARACEARSQPFDRYRTAPEREDNRL
jgi:hypothetical protein